VKGSVWNISANKTYSGEGGNTGAQIKVPCQASMDLHPVQQTNKNIFPLYLSLTDRIIVANPGTGKTTEIVEEVARLLRSGVKGEDIACVTFTNKAADEMKKRVFQKVRKDLPSLINEAFQIEVSTIHGYAKAHLQAVGKTSEITSNTTLRFVIFQRLLELNTFNYGREYLIENLVPKFENSIRYLKSFGILPGRIDVAQVTRLTQEKMSYSKNLTLSKQATERLVKDFVDVFATYEKYKDEHKVVDFNDLLRDFNNLENFPKRSHVLVDEFQDLNRLQTDIVSRMAENRFFVGDRKQSIFGFQGGSLSSFHRFLNDSGFSVDGRSRNYRSTNNILDFAKKYYVAYSKDDGSRKEVESLNNPDKEYGEKVSLIASPDPESNVVDLVTRFLAENRNKNEDIAVIARTNSQVEKISAQIQSAGIEFSSTIKNRISQKQINEILDYVRGLVSSVPMVVSRALLTPFSGLTLQEAVNTVQQLEKGGLKEEFLPEKFRVLRNLKFGANLMEEAFERVILPICSSMSQEYVASALSVLNSSREYLSNFTEFSMEGFTDFMSLASDSTEDDLKKSRVNVLTVHKAKGLEFHTVIYAPTEPRKNLEFMDNLTTSIISTTTGINVMQDLEEEPIRIDFVALTRAKEKLIVMASDKLVSRYQVGGDNYTYLESDFEKSSFSNRRYDESYNLFIAGRKEDAMALIHRSKVWLPQKISDYFRSIDHLSYSTITSINDPYHFLKNYILGIRDFSPAASSGSNFHALAQLYANGTLPKEAIPEELKAHFRNFDLLLDQIRPEYQIPPKFSEYKIVLPLNTVFENPWIPEEIMLEGRLDAVYEGSGKAGKFLVADYKTSKSTGTEYWHQLWLYTRMLQKKFSIEPEKISGAIMYVSLREPVDTGNLGSALDVREFQKIRTDVVERRLSEFLGYTNEPELFIERLLSKSPTTEMEMRIRDSLERAV
jgi:DNA helicase-2/ATP-dependent DNA helicase PcrA